MPWSFEGVENRFGFAEESTSHQFRHFENIQGRATNSKTPYH